MTVAYTITAYWGPRREGPAACATRLSRMLDALSAIDPVFGNWYCASRMKMVAATSLDAKALAALIEKGVSREDTGEPFAENGYWFGAFNDTRKNPRAIEISIHAGCSTSGVNLVSLKTMPLNEENASFINLPVLKPAMLAIVSAWEATWCVTYPMDLFRLRTSATRPWFSLAWMTYISPRFAPMITAPRAAISERLSNGALLMIASEERFETENPSHLAVARDIEAALAPVNALPWPRDAAPEQ
jgi:immunity protein 52 of polymorphic toxin system